MQLHIRAPLRFALFLCSSITLLGIYQSPAEAASMALVSLTPNAGNNALELFDKYKHIANADVEEAIARIHEFISQAIQDVKHLYAIAERQLLKTVGLALNDSANAQLLYRVEIPTYINRVNNAVDDAIVKIDLDVGFAVAEIRQIFQQAEANIAAAIANVNVKVSEESTAQIIADAAASLERTIERNKANVQRNFFWANLMVQAYIWITERRVHQVMPLPVADRVNADITNASVNIDRVEKLAVANVEASLMKVRNAVHRLSDFLDDLEKER